MGLFTLGFGFAVVGLLCLLVFYLEMGCCCGLGDLLVILF